VWFLHARVWFLHAKNDLNSHECYFYTRWMIFMSTSVISTRPEWFSHPRVWFLHDESNFYTQKRDFFTQRIIFKHTSVISTCNFYTQRVSFTCTRVIPTHREWFSRAQVWFLHAESVFHTHECDFQRQRVISFFGIWVWFWLIKCSQQRLRNYTQNENQF
jgi:hypothetical protein